MGLRLMFAFTRSMAPSGPLAQTLHGIQPGGSVAVAIVASRAPGHQAWVVFLVLEQRINNTNESYEKENRSKQSPFGSVHGSGRSAQRRCRRDKDQRWCLRRHDAQSKGSSIGTGNGYRWCVFQSKR